MPQYTNKGVSDSKKKDKKQETTIEDIQAIGSRSPVGVPAYSEETPATVEQQMMDSYLREQNRAMPGAPAVTPEAPATTTPRAMPGYGGGNVPESPDLVDIMPQATEGIPIVEAYRNMMRRLRMFKDERKRTIVPTVP